LIRPKNGMLVMEQLHYADEMRPATEVPLEEGEVKPTELELAKQLIEQTATDEFHPERYKDTVRDRVMEAIQGKVEGEEIIAAPAEEPQAQIIDLMAALKASLAKKGQSGAEETDEKPAKKKAGKKKAG
jgi:DNA end-binding protein Ku